VRVGQHVAVSVDPSVARTLRDGDRGVVDHVRELPGRVTLGGDVARAVLVGRGDEAERGRGQPLPIEIVQRRPGLAHHPRQWCAHQSDKLVDGADRGLGHGSP
jgi:hypothetical protein